VAIGIMLALIGIAVVIAQLRHHRQPQAEGRERPHRRLG